MRALAHSLTSVASCSFERSVDERYVPDSLARFLISLVRKTREVSGVVLGASPRAAIHRRSETSQRVPRACPARPVVLRCVFEHDLREEAVELTPAAGRSDPLARGNTRGADHDPANPGMEGPLLWLGDRSCDYIGESNKTFGLVCGKVEDRDEKA